MTGRPSDEHLDRLLARSLGDPAASAGVCPDGEVLAAYVDGGLDPTERTHVTQHAAACARCAQILAIAVEPPATTPAGNAEARPWLLRWRWLVPFATAVTVTGIWVATRDVVPPVTRPAPAAVAESAAVEEPPPQPVPAAPPPAIAAPQTSRQASQPAPKLEERREAPAQILGQEDVAQLEGVSPAPPAPAPAAAAPPPPPAVPAPLPSTPPAAPSVAQEPVGRGGDSGRGTGDRIAGGVVGGFAAPPSAANAERPVADAVASRRELVLPLWRYRGTAIERSLDGGQSWRSEFDPGRTVLASAMPSTEIGWFVGVRGLVVRRAGTTWSIVTAPAGADVTGVQATGERNATVTLRDGRVFATTDGGATWSPR